MVARKTKRQRTLEYAVDMLRKPGARLIKSHDEWFITPNMQVSTDIAEEIKARPDVCGGKDGLWPGHDQTWGFG